jgi:hypothetical protein
MESRKNTYKNVLIILPCGFPQRKNLKNTVFMLSRFSKRNCIAAVHMGYDCLEDTGFLV